ncbi:hypothetical protein JCM10213_009107 [Rhodosporidiobolus nylandii]
MGKVDQLVQHFYAKTLAVVSQARLTHQLDPSASVDVPSSSAGGGGAAGSTASVAPGMVPSASGSRRVSGAGGKEAKKGKTNKWFNLELPDSPLFRDELKTWRSVSSLLSSASASSAHPFSACPSPPQAAVPPMVLETLLDVSDLTPNQVLVLQSSSPGGKRARVDPSLAARPTVSPPPTALPRGMRSPLRATSRSRGSGPSTPTSSSSSAPSVVLERWVLRLLPSPPSSSSSSSSSSLTELPTVYKHSIQTFRSLFTLMRALPAYQLHRSLARRRAGVGGAGLKLGVRLAAVEEERREGEVGVEVPIGEEDGRTTESITFPGVVTPLGTLSLTLTYRLNTSFAVEEIETLLSSRFIDEDFFRPTIARYKQPEEVAPLRPGSLPISSRILAPGPSGTSPAKASPPAGVAALERQPGMTGLAPLPSYGSLSSRHHYAPPPQQHSPREPSPLSTSPPQLPPPSPRAGVSPLPAPVPVPPAVAPPAVASSLSTSASSRFSAYAPPGTSAGGIVEPAFISLSRARGASFAGGAGSGIQRASPLSSSPAGGGIVRRTSVTSTGSGSPVFRPGSYIASTAAGAGDRGISNSPSYSGSYGPITRQHPVPVPFPSTSSSSLSNQFQIGARSPLAPAVPHAGPSMLGATAPATSAGARAIPAASPAGVGVGIAIGAGAGVTPPSSSLGRGGAGPFGSAGTGSYTSRSYGRGSSSGGEGGGVGYGWSGPDSGGGVPVGAPGLQRRASSRLSFGASAGAGSSLGRSSRLAQLAAQEEEPKKRFVHEGRPPDDAEDINAFLGMLESKPDLKGSMGASRSAFGGGGGGGRSMLMSKRDVDEQMRALRSSVFGGSAGGDGHSPSPPSFGLDRASPAQPSLPRSGPSGLSNIASLRKQTSRLSIKEDAAGEAAAAAVRDRGRSPSSGSGEEGAKGRERQHTTPRAAYRPLSSHRRDSLVSPSLSATSSSTVIPTLPPLSLGPDTALAASPIPSAATAAGRFAFAAIEPRFLPLPHSSTTSPLASPAVSREREPYSFASAAALQVQPYPPLPYPPAATTTTSTSTEPITLTPAFLSSPVARAVRQPLPPSHRSGGGFSLADASLSPSPAGAGSIASFDDVETDVEAALSRADYGGEVEAVGRLELDESPSALLAAEERGRRWGQAVGVGPGGEAALADAAAAAQAQASRDSTPAAARGVGYFGLPRRERTGSGESAGGRSPPDISWMG